MKRFALAILGAFAVTASAQAADISEPIVHDWTGFYAGGHLGYGWGTDKWDDPSVPPVFATDEDDPDVDIEGILGGAQAGFDYQIGSIVLGIAGDIAWTDIDGDTTLTVSPDNLRSDIEWLATLTARLGFAADRALFYVKGGAAFAEIEREAGLDVSPGSDFRDKDSPTGWTAGAGVEWAFADNWSVGLEYNYIDLGSDTVELRDNDGGSFDADVDLDINIVKAMLNYRF
jgi:outer membrane immunogenic protein